MVARFGVLAVLVVLLATLPAGASARQGWPAVRNGTIKPDRLHGTAGPDYLRGHEGPDRIGGGAGDDLLMGDTGGDRVDGGEGDDTITGAAGGDDLSGDGGADVINGGFGSDRISGGAGDDTLDGANDMDVISGGPGDDLIHGGSGQDYIDGGPGNDYLFADSGAGVVLGGDGDDTIVVEDSAGLRVDCGGGTDTLYVVQPAGITEDFSSRDSSIARRAPHCERVLLTDDVPDPNQGTKYLAGDAGGTKDGTAKDDILLGGPGADVLHGFSGNDVLWGLRQAGVTSTLPDVLDAGPGDDTIYGGPGPQQIAAGPGDDFVNGGLGRNTITGGPGDDTIRLRGDGVDAVDAGPGNDTIYAAGPARGRVRCGPGSDTVYASGNDAVAKDCEHVSSGKAGKPRRLRAAPRTTATRALARRAGLRAAATTYASLVRATPGLVTRFRLDESAGDTRDDVGFASGYVDGPKNIPGATDDYDTAWQVVTPLLVNTDDPVRRSTAGSIEFWARTGFTPAAREIVMNDAGSTDRYDPGTGILIAALSGGRFAATLTSYDGGRSTLTSAPSDRAIGGWHHVVLTRDGTTAKLYVDGDLADSQPDRATVFPPGVYPQQARWSFGGAYPNAAAGITIPAENQTWFSGALDEIAVYTTALDAATVSAHARFGQDATPPTTLMTTPIPAAIPARFDTILYTAKAGSAFFCTVDGGAEFACPARLGIRLPTGAHTLRIRAVDRYGLAEVAPKTYAFTVDATVPRTQAVAKIGRSGDDYANVAFASDDPAATFQCLEVDGRATPAWQPCVSPLVRADLANVSTLQVRAVDAAGNIDPTPAIVQVPLEFGAPRTLPALAASRADVVIENDDTPFPSAVTCRLDANPAAACPDRFRLPIMGIGPHTLTVTQTAPGRTPMSSTVRWTVMAPPAGTVELAAPQFPAVVENAVQLERRVPRVRFLLSTPATVRLTLRSAAGGLIGELTARGVPGANALKIPAAALRRLKLGRYVLVLSAQGATGAASAQALPFALIPRTR